MVTIRNVEGEGTNKPNLPSAEVKTVSSSGRKYKHGTNDKKLKVKQNIEPLPGSITIEKKELKEKNIKDGSQKTKKKGLTNIFHTKKSEKKAETKNPPFAGAPDLHSSTKGLSNSRKDDKENKNEPEEPPP